MLPKPPFAVDIHAADKILNQKAGPFAVPYSLPVGAGRPSNDTLNFLQGIQGNVLKPHGRTFVSLLFFRFKQAAATTADRERNGRFLAKVAAMDAVLTNALQQYSDAYHKRRDRGKKPFVSLMLTTAGVKATDRPMPQEPNGVDSFARGMLAQHEFLGDPSRNGRPSTWRKVFQREAEIHGMWLVAHRTDAGLRAKCRFLAKLGRDCLQITHEERGVNMRDSEGFTREPFGFRDGLSMPQFFRGVRGAGPLDNPPLERVLIDSNGGPDHGGSFMVYRKLEQDVAAFRRFEGALAPHLRAAGLSARDPGRVLVGRDRKGVPLVKHPPHPRRGQKLGNNFTFAKDMAGARCPFHAHIRKANFRQPPVGGNLSPNQQLQGQFVRRGATYGRGPRWNPRAVKEPTGGLQFMAYMSNISGQFETMQTTWFQKQEFPLAEMQPNQIDPGFFGGAGRKRQWFWTQAGICPVALPHLVTPRGGAYFFVPPLRWLAFALAAPALPAKA